MVEPGDKIGKEIKETIHGGAGHILWGRSLLLMNDVLPLHCVAFVSHSAVTFRSDFFLKIKRYTLEKKTRSRFNFF